MGRPRILSSGQIVRGKTGPIGPPGPPGPPGSAPAVGIYPPESYGAVGNGTANDTAAVQAAIDAADAAGGGIVLLTKRYGWTGDLLHKGGVTVMGTGIPKYTVPEAVEGGLIALNATARYRYGQWGGGSSGNDNPGAVRDLVINGNYLATELFRMECVDGLIENCHIIRAAASGKCVEVGGSQNSTLDMVHMGYGGKALSFDVGSGGGQSAGMIRFNDCYLATSGTLLYGSTDPLHFPPHEILFTNTLFEDRGSNNRLIDLRAGEWQFRSCIVTNSDALTKPDNDCLVHVTNAVKTDWGTQVTFDSCYFNGGSSSPKPTDIIRVGTAGSVTNELRLYGVNRAYNATNLICFDGTNALTSIMGAVYRGSGLGWFRSINGGNAFNLRHDTITAYRWAMPADASLPNPIGVRTEGDAQDRWWIEKDGKHVWGNGADLTVRASKVYSSSLDAMLFGGLWRFENGFALRSLLHTITTPGQAVAMSGARTAAPGYSLVFSLANATAAVTIADGVPGSQIQVTLDNTAAVSGAAVTWPSNVKNAPQPVGGQLIVVNLVKGLDGNWWCSSCTPLDSAILGHSERSTDGTQSITTGGSAQVILFPTSTVADRGGLTYSNGVWTCGRAGRYPIDCYVSLPNGAGARRQVSIRKNGVTQVSTNQTPPTTGVWSTTISHTMDLAVGDTVDFTTFQDSGGSLTVTARATVTNVGR